MTSLKDNDSIEFSLEGGIATLTLNRPEKKNALTLEMIETLSLRLEEMYESQAIRLVVLRSNGDTFCAGADIEWMKESAQLPEAINNQQALSLAKMFRLMNELNKPTIGVIQGDAYGGGLGLLACLDIVLASNSAKFCLPEAKLGLIPAVIAPFLDAKIGESALRHLMLRCHTISAQDAHQLGLVHEIYQPPRSDEPLQTIIHDILQASPNAQAAAKGLMFALNDHYMDGNVDKATSELIAKLRQTKEGQEGLSAFLEKRKPYWIKD